MRVRMPMAILLALLIGAGCGRETDNAPSTTQASSPRSQVTIGYCAPEWGGAQYQIMQGVRSRAEARGWRCIVLNANFDAAVQARQVDYLIEAGVDAIVAVPLDSDQIQASINRAHAKGIPFYTVDRAPSRGSATLIVQADNTLAGRLAGEFAADLLREKYKEIRGTILQLRGDTDQTVTHEREGGFRQTFQGNTAVAVIDRDTQWQPKLFADAASEVLQARDVDLIYLHSDMIGVPEVLPVLRRLGRLHKHGEEGHICIVGVDAGPPALDGIRQGFVDAAACHPVTKYGVVTYWIESGLKGAKIRIGPVSLAEDGVSGQIVDGPAGPLLQLLTDLVTRDNVDDEEHWGNHAALVRERKEPPQ